ncbi:hypothetical protein LshimejAT787_0212110 [Lyophyllum shimeji]|uniref:Uncharacterized protein n=1 Tax=Lyophyllum shimeji TaxID=47721 RepID=A0A9P3PGZ5_LYOSH|nr:hypothetical protein LshimejAT787_0212110 [Lyophyllum shimeji]
MDLTLVNNDPSNTLLVAEDGPRYEIDTPRDTDTPTTTIVRIEGEMLLYDSNLELLLHPGNGLDQLGQLVAFLGPDNRPYKWQIFIQSPVLILDDNSNTLLGGIVAQNWASCRARGRLSWRYYRLD